MISFEYVLKEDIPKIWNKIQPMLERAVKLDPDKYNIEDVKAVLEDGTYTLWVSHDKKNENILGVLTTRFMEFPNSNGIGIDFIAGTRMKDWIEIGHKTIEKYARKNNCKFIQGFVVAKRGKAWDKFIGL